MSSSTFATVIIEIANQAEAQEDLPGNFTALFTTNEESLPPATHVITKLASGFFLSSELDFMVNEAKWPYVIRFDDAQSTLLELNLKAVV